jgi:hypothetical protein
MPHTLLPKFLRPLLSGGSAVLVVVLAAGCGGAEAYERGKLAHPTMVTSDLAGPAEAHARAIQEGAMGGEVGVGGGCGCN